MNHEKIDFIHNLTDLEVRYIPKENHDVLSSLYSLEGDFPESGKVELVKDSTGVRFISSVYDTGILLTGPFILEGDPIPRIGGNNLAGIELPARSESKVHSYLTVLKLLTEQKELPGVDAESEIETHNPVFEESYRPDIELIDKRYKWERKIRHFIALGDRASLKKLIYDLEEGFDFSSRMPNNPVRAYKNMAIVTNSIGRLSAEKGGLPPFLLHSLSENISIQIEKLSSLKDVIQYTSRIPLQYCDAVHNYGIENHSAVIVKACHYILENLHEKIGLDDLAEHTGTNRSYLSRRFHQETGKTISAYIREKRILEAKWMLRHSGEPVTDVALSLGFEDINYFSRIFRKEAGVSPRDYKNRYSSGDFDGLPP
ncbi:AraC family transcriptional regulator [Spirochaeta isovalerica]|uniref:AraC-like DNA-binding protein n=1 Tax=Spirochaeta isovalerica TaxID=150 RepID=A0A841R5K6_9SPIO|nr:AraC family transcriptional regulator [Spirochaeta isovalerica]MBB6480464.1 AraC-like DNA-binding protein [Spirochaeta isovalerica]